MLKKHNVHHNVTQITNVRPSGFFSSLFSGVGGAAGCCIGILIILGIIVAILSSNSSN